MNPQQDNDLTGEPDARLWAKRFVQRYGENPAIASDEATMLAWFSGAIMAGYDNAQRLADQEPL